MTRLFQLSMLFAVLCVGVSLALAQDDALRGPMIEPECDARMIARHVRGIDPRQPPMTITEYMNVINLVHKGGGIDDRYAARLRMLIEEAYQMPSERALVAWVERRCAPHGKPQ